MREKAAAIRDGVARREEREVSTVDDIGRSKLQRFASDNNSN